MTAPKNDKARKMTANQCRTLILIRDAGEAAFWNTNTYRSLIQRGLIERCDRTTKVAHSMTFTKHLCRITDAGRAALEGRKP